MAKYEVTLNNEQRDFVEVDADSSLLDVGELEFRDARGDRVAAFNKNSWLFFKKTN